MSTPNDRRGQSRPNSRAAATKSPMVVPTTTWTIDWAVAIPVEKACLLPDEASLAYRRRPPLAKPEGSCTKVLLERRFSTTAVCQEVERTPRS